MSTLVSDIPRSLKPGAQAPAWNGRGFLWFAVFVASRCPEVICRELGFNGGVGVSPLFGTILLISLAIATARLYPNKNLAGFIFALATLTFSWRLIVPWIESSPAFLAASNHLSWGAHFLALRALRTIGSLCLLATLIGSGIGRRALFLRLGDWGAAVRSEPFFRFPRPISWRYFSLTLLLIFAVLLPAYLYWSLDPQSLNVHRVLLALPWAAATSALNAANEEFQFRSVLLARLANVVPMKEAFLVVAVVFGVGHYFGQPSGWGGVLMAGFAGWIWAKSMVETRGFSCAFAMHFVQDMVIFCFLAMSGTNLSFAWS